ncbi:TIGR00296 family protein [Vulcanisaeta souniana]|uniref:Protein GCM10007112_00700 n=1 Tax=Vulcanisaeta souniana JCM 11219 TaxID=1293586 RepID=A0A830EBZ9_9CREN|nr:TIGR00296 family protein [Vulcanisaeta souniana]BDR92146.1 TIGR00296 family protein [Vulcanisaeta souniana JCM 11219]GGI67610.1 TIGR00296 family protein [Vulcanisaeta souniana JCM 11219]
MFKPYSIEEGEFLVKLARKAVYEYLRSGKVIQAPPDTPPKLFKDKYGVFTTIEVFMGRNRRGELRGCIGFPQAVYNTVNGVIRSAIAAATEDPRFERMSTDELNNVTFEISVLSPLELLEPGNPRSYPNKIVVGRHGIVIQKGYYSGLLLPQVPVEYCWDSLTFLNEGCMKAFLPPDCWLDEDTSVLVYEAQIFKEAEPNGEVIERNLIEELKGCKNDAASKG